MIKATVIRYYRVAIGARDIGLGIFSECDFLQPIATTEVLINSML
ncbi:MAG: hypothetical protein V7690_09720 [Shewanella sp.]